MLRNRGRGSFLLTYGVFPVILFLKSFKTMSSRTSPDAFTRIFFACPGDTVQKNKDETVDDTLSSAGVLQLDVAADLVCDYLGGRLFDLVLTSPATQAHETATSFCVQLGLHPSVIMPVDELLPPAGRPLNDWADCTGVLISGLIARVPPELTRAILICGHAKSLPALASAIIEQAPGIDQDECLKKAASAKMLPGEVLALEIRAKVKDNQIHYCLGHLKCPSQAELMAM